MLARLAPRFDGICICMLLICIFLGYIRSMLQGGAPLRCAAPEPLLCLAAAPDGSLLAGGGASGRLYLWAAGSGELLRAWGGHYKAVTALAFSPCGSVLASGGGDGLLHLWDSATAADIATSAAPAGSGAAIGGAVLAPAVTWSEHSLTITALAWGPTAGGGGGGLSAPLLSASADRTVRAWDAASRLPLAVLSFPAPVTALAVDGSSAAVGATIFAGCDDGSIHAVPLQPGRASGSLGAVGAGESGSAARPGSAAGGVSFAGHAGPVTDLALAPPCVGGAGARSLGSAASSSSSSSASAGAGAGAGAGSVSGAATGARLVSAGADGLVRIWEPRSGQQIAALDPARAAAAAGGASAGAGSSGAGASSRGGSAASAGVVALLLARADRVAPPPAGTGSSGRFAGGGAGLGADGAGALGLGAHAAGVADPIGSTAAAAGWGAAFLAPPRKFARPLPPGWLDGSGGAASAAGPADADILVRILPSVATVAGGSVPLACDAGAGAFAEPAAGTAVDASAHAAASLQSVVAALEAAAAVAAAKGLPSGPPVGAADAGAADAAVLAASQAEAAALRERVAALESENARWRAVNSKLAERLQGQTPATGAAAPAAAAGSAPASGVGAKRPR